MTRTKRLLPALLLAALACLAAASPALALDLNPANYLQINYNPVTFDKTRVTPGEVFHTTITGQAQCMKSIPVPVSEATIASQIVARDPATGASYPLDTGFTININPFPDKAGQTYDINVPIDMTFPAGTTPGDYQVDWKLVQARAKISFVWTDVTGSLPSEQSMGNITVTIPSTTTSAPSAPPGTTSAPPASTTTSIATTTTTPVHPIQPLFTGWLIVLAAAGAFVVAAIIAFVLVIVLRRRG